MSARETWHGLQSHLSAARALLDAGDHEQALAEADAALAIDPQFLAAQSLRERILAVAPRAAPRRPTAPPASAPPASVPPRVVASPAHSQPAPAHSIAVPPAQPASRAAPAKIPVSAVAAVDTVADLPLRVPVIQAPPNAETGYARFEQRAKRRRVDRRLDAARSAIAQGRIHDASSALEEVRHLDPNATELRELTIALANLRRASVTPRRGAWLAAALAFGVTVFAASWLEENQHALLSHPMLAISGLVETPHHAMLAGLAADAAPAAESRERETPTSAPVGTSGPTDSPSSASVSTTAAASFGSMPSSTPLTAAPAAAMPTRPVPPPSIPLAPAQLHAALPAAPPPTAPPAVSTSSGLSFPVAGASSVDAPPIVSPSQRPQPDEAALVRQALQRYRVAYDGLDAGSAQAVWPAVNEGALAKAFEGLESQKLTFDDCRVQLQNETATATCRGTTRYVPKVGSRDPRTEPRVWNFSLRKNGGEWKIDNARVER